MIGPALLALALVAPPAVVVDLLASRSPRAAILAGPGGTRSVAAGPEGLTVDGLPAPALALPQGTWTVALAGERPRSYDAALEVQAAGGTLRLRARMPLESYVASVVASEATPGTPAAALEALAVVVRSYALAARERHAGGVLCDLAHCQVLRGAGVARGWREAGARAARVTEGEVLALRSGAVAEATFHAACGGHTADPEAAFGSAASGARAAPDPGCAGPRWRIALEPAAVAGAVRAALDRSGSGRSAAVPRRLRAADVVLARGPGGWISAVEARDRSWRLSGDAFARALDAVVGRGRVRSTRLTLEDEQGGVVARGVGHGHGVGLCQAGAARHAAEGDDHRRILARYFGARVTKLREWRDLPRARGD